MAINSEGLPPSAYSDSPSAYESEMLGFANESIQEAEVFLRSTEGYSKIVPTMQAIMGVNVPIRPTYLSHTSSNEIGRLASTIRAELTDVKPSAEFKTYNSQLEQTAVNFGKMWTSWYYNQSIDQKLGGVIDYALVAGTGFAHQIWNKFTQDIDVIAYDPRDVLPIRPTDNSIQSAMGVVLRREMTVNAVRAMFPQKAHLIREDRSGTTSKLPEVTRESVMQQRTGISPWERAQLQSQPAKSIGAGIPVVDLYYYYITDPATNRSNTAVQVGDFRKNGTAANLYSYIAAPGDALYPRKRLVIFTKTAILYDGPNIYWHGMYPVSKYTLDPWQWSWLGHTPIWDCLPLQDTLNRCLRIIDDHVARVLRPPVVGDKTSVSESEIKALSESLGRPGATLRRNPMGQGVEIQEVPALDAIITTLIEFCVQKMEQRCGVQDLTNLMSLGQMPEGSTVDKLMFATRPEIRSRSRMLEVLYREQGKMFLYNSAQFYTNRRKFALLGPQGMQLEDFDFDPSSIFPVASDDPRPKFDIADQYLRQIGFYVAPSSLLRSAHTTDQMMALTLFREGAIDPETLLERLDFPNVQQVLKRLSDMMQMKAAAEMAGAGGLMGGRGGGPLGNPMGGAPQGRPPGNQPPEMRSDGYVSQSNG